MLRAILLLLSIVALGGCTVPIERFDSLTPQDCRAYGVEVSDDDTRTGRVVHSEFGTFHKMEKKCWPKRESSPNMHSGAIAGCATQADRPYPHFPSVTGDYAIYYAEHKCVPYHEACHALYETRQHTVAYNIRIMQGDWLAACPVEGRK